MKIPRATYRLQFNSGFGFKAAGEIVPYLAELGISQIYASPVFKARQGSSHGYDVVDPNQLNSELGTEEDFHELIEIVHRHDMGWIQDVVPNHMAYDYENKMLMDLLENGPDSRYFNFFDVEWEHLYENIRGKILAPFLGRFYAECLEAGELKLNYDASGFFIQYYDHRFPLRIDSYSEILDYRLDLLKYTAADEEPELVKLPGVIYALKSLPSGEQPERRKEQVEFIKKLLWEVYSGNPRIKKFLDRNIDIFNGQNEQADRFHLLDQLLSRQYFRLSFWKVGTEEINYRRFFNVNELISLRMDDAEVFEETHSLLARLINAGRIDGLRIDHVDGLYDPGRYLQRLRKKFGDIYLVVEKILEFTEELPADWPVQGTTGYNFLNCVNGVFCQREHKTRFQRIYRKFTRNSLPFQNLTHDKKRMIIGKHMAGDVDNLAHLLSRVASHYRYGSDFTLYGLRRTLVELLAWFPVYRTYISPGEFSENDKYYMRAAIEKAKKTIPDFIHELSFIERVLFLVTGRYFTETERDRWLHFVMRFQQLTGPLMAKGFEDTVLYNYNQLISLNEVGGDPDKFGISAIEFHYFNKKRTEHWLNAMNATSTHDVKRGEDVRARINVLSEIPEEWEKIVLHWSKLNRARKKKVKGSQAPDRNDEYFLYQTLLGAFPPENGNFPEFVERIKRYIIKAVREAKLHTEWLKPDQEYENAFLNFIEKILDGRRENPFLTSFIPFQRKIAFFGRLNALAQTLIKMTAPGVPDFYQGSELWELNLVDPDNRRPVDFSRRKKVLKKFRDKPGKNPERFFRDLLANSGNGEIKLFLIFRILQARRSDEELFSAGSYLPLEVDGELKNHVLAFARNTGNRWAVTVVPRFLAGLGERGDYPLSADFWRDTAVYLPADFDVMQDAVTGRRLDAGDSLPAGEILSDFPLALLLGESS